MTTTTTGRADEVTAYLEEVAVRLTGLPEAERAELLDDLAHHLAEVMAEPGPPLSHRVGPPADYAAELLASAGFAVPGPGPGRGRRLVPAPLRSALARALRALRSSPVGRELVLLEPVLRPTWWVARGYLAVSFVAAWTRGPGGPGYPGFPVPRLLGSPLLGLLAVLVAVPVSVRFGRAQLGRGRRRLVVAANAVLLLYGLLLLGRSGGPPAVHVVGNAPGVEEPTCLLDRGGRPITNLYAYGTDGALLDPILLYDQAGRPIDHLCPQFDAAGRRLRTEYGRDVNGAPVINAFPRRQWVEPDSDVTAPDGSVVPVPGPAVPVRPPAVVVPRLQPPPPPPSIPPATPATPPAP